MKKCVVVERYQEYYQDKTFTLPQLFEVKIQGSRNRIEDAGKASDERGDITCKRAFEKIGT